MKRSVLVGMMMVGFAWVHFAGAFTIFPRNHQAITWEGLRGIEWQGVGFSEESMLSIAEANVDTDLVEILALIDVTRSGPPYWHFDNESFLTSNRTIVRRIDRMKTMLTSGDVNEARRQLGRALHTLQDFYSHSTWIERDNTDPMLNLGTSDAIFSATAVTTCTDSFDTFAMDTGGRPFLTTGYYGVASQEGKCQHGSLFPSEDWDGINKDRDGRTRPPPFQSDDFDMAKSVATRATKNFVQRVIDEMDRAGMQVEICLLLGLEADGDLCPYPTLVYQLGSPQYINIPSSIVGSRTLTNDGVATTNEIITYPVHVDNYMPAYNYQNAVDLPRLCRVGDQWLQKTEVFPTYRDFLPADTSCTFDGRDDGYSATTVELRESGDLTIIRNDTRDRDFTRECSESVKRWTGTSYDSRIYKISLEDLSGTVAYNYSTTLTIETDSINDSQDYTTTQSHRENSSAKWGSTPGVISVRLLETVPASTGIPDACLSVTHPQLD